MNTSEIGRGAERPALRTLVIGDIHGCHDELRDLLEAGGIGSDDRIVSAGDFVDRGPDSPRVFDWVFTSANVSAVMGNHERKHVRSFRGEIAPALSQTIARRQFGEDRYPAAVALMAELPTFLKLDGALVVHAYFEPGLPVEHQAETVLTGTMSGDKRIRRVCGDAWYQFYDGPLPLIVGHHDYLETGAPLIWKDRVFGIDTGCCHGGRLTGVVLPEFRIVSVPARANHWARTTQKYRRSG